MEMTRRLLLCAALLMLTSCSTVSYVDAGCISYGNSRISRPELREDGLSRWAATLDTSMTETCH